MRTTLNTIYSTIQTNLNRITSDMDKVNAQMSSGLQMSTISDNPVNLVSALRFRSSIAEIDQYTKNIQNGNTVIGSAESALTQMKDLVMRAKTLAIQATDPSYSAANRQSIAQEVDNLFQSAVSLGNSQVNGEYIFGGFRSTGYTAAEPTPFIADKGDGYWVNGASLAPQPSALTSGPLGSVSDLAAGALTVNGAALGAVTLTSGLSNGLNMSGAANLKTAVNATGLTPPVTASLTTLTSGGASNGATGGEAISLTINGVAVAYTATAGGPAAAAQEAVTQINQVSAQSGVTAVVGDGTNGGPANSVVLSNTLAGDESTITVAGLNDPTGVTGLANVSQAADASHNSGRISLTSGAAISLTSNVANDSVLNQVGLGGGGKGNYDLAGDGKLVYGYPLSAGELTINGITVPTPASDGLSDRYANASAAAKASAINSVQAQTGVSAQVTPASASASGPVSAGTMNSTDLTINGVAIFAAPTAILSQDSDNTLLAAINAKAAQTGVKATRGDDGSIRLTAQDGRNLHIQTSAAGEQITQLTGGVRDQVVSGSLQLRSDRKFILQTVDPTVNPDEPGLAALGLAGGTAVTGEGGDVAGDGKIDVFSIHDQTGTVRYAGDRVNDLAIKIGETTTMTVGSNGQSAVADTGVFTALKSLENDLLAQNFTTVTGIHAATDTTATLNSKTTGLEPASQLPTEDLFSKGSFTVTVTDHSYSPPKDQTMNIAVDPTVDTLNTVTQRLDGIPNLQASWGSDGKLTVAVKDPSRYTVALSNDSSNFLSATGISTDFMQSQSLSQSLTDLDGVMDKLSQQISDSGARANRIDIQNQIYSELSISTKDNLSQAQDTDMVQAVMDLQAKQTAYQAALASASKTMQLSLVDYLK